MTVILMIMFDGFILLLAEEFLLVVKRTDFIPPDENLKGPSTSEVLAATKHIPLSRVNQATANFNVGMLQTDVSAPELE